MFLDVSHIYTRVHKNLHIALKIVIFEVLTDIPARTRKSILTSDLREIAAKRNRFRASILIPVFKLFWTLFFEKKTCVFGSKTKRF